MCASLPFLKLTRCDSSKSVKKFIGSRGTTFDMSTEKKPPQQWRFVDATDAPDYPPGYNDNYGLEDHTPNSFPGEYCLMNVGTGRAGSLPLAGSRWLTCSRWLSLALWLPGSHWLSLALAGSLWLSGFYCLSLALIVSLALTVSHWNIDYSSSTISVYTLALTLSSALYNSLVVMMRSKEIKRNQDFKICFHSESLILSHWRSCWLSSFCCVTTHERGCRAIHRGHRDRSRHESAN